MQESILVIEDDLSFLEIISDLFISRNLSFDRASSFKEVKEILNGKSYDIVVTDLNLFDADKVNLCSYIKKNNNTSFKLIIMSGLTKDESKERLIGCDYDLYLLKPFYFSDLVDGILSFQEEDSEESYYDDIYVSGLTISINKMIEGLGSLEVAQGYFNIFKERFCDQIKSIEDALSNFDFVKAYHFTHNLKGSVGNFYVDELSNLLVKIEVNLNNNNEIDAGKILKDFVEKTKIVLNELEHFFSSNHS